MGGAVCFCFASFVTSLDIYFKCHACAAVVHPDYTFCAHTLQYIGPRQKGLHESESESTDYIVRSPFDMARVKGVDTWGAHDEEIQGTAKLLTITSHRLSLTKNGDLSVLGKSHHPFEC